jgi:hypothetical protein
MDRFASRSSFLSWRDRAYFSEVLIEVTLVLSLVGARSRRHAAAINPYLIAVAPDSPAMNCLKLVVIDGAVAFATGTATGFSRTARRAMLQSIYVRAGSGNSLIVRFSDRTGTPPLAPQPPATPD